MEDEMLEMRSVITRCLYEGAEMHTRRAQGGRRSPAASEARKVVRLASVTTRVFTNSKEIRGRGGYMYKE